MKSPKWLHVLTIQDSESAWRWGRMLANAGYIVKVVCYNSTPPRFVCYQRLLEAPRGKWGEPTRGELKPPIPGQGLLYWHRDGKRLRFCGQKADSNEQKPTE